MSEKEDIYKRTLAKMFEGAKAENKEFNERLKIRKQLKQHLEVLIL